MTNALSREPLPPTTGLILAAQRRGVSDPVAALQNKSHKCLVEIDGEVMLVRVIRSLREADRFSAIFVSIEDEAPLRTVPALAAWLDDGTIAVVNSAGNLADSVFSAVEQIERRGHAPWPLLIMTADNALQTPELVRDFLEEFGAMDADIGVGFTRDEVVEAAYPEAGLAYHRLKDGGFSSINLYAMRSAVALEAARVFKSGGQFGKRHIRLLKAFGLMSFVLYKTKAVTGAELVRRIGRGLGVRIEMVLSRHPYGPIDVDNLSSFALCERILAKRRQSPK